MGAGHSHDHDGEHGAAAAFDPTLVRWLTITAAALGLATLVGIVALWPSDRARTDIGSLGVSRTSYAATVTAVEEFACPGSVDLDPESDGLDALDEQEDGDRPPGRCATVTFRLSEGPDTGESRSVELFDIDAQPEIGVGDPIVVPYLASADEPFQYASQFERERGWPMLVLAVAFAALVVIQGRLRGGAALAARVVGGRRTPRRSPDDAGLGAVSDDSAW